MNPDLSVWEHKAAVCGLSLIISFGLMIALAHLIAFIRDHS